jgi:hypothetical protein
MDQFEKEIHSDAREARARQVFNAISKQKRPDISIALILQAIDDWYYKGIKHGADGYKEGIDYYSAPNFTRSTNFIGHEGQDIIKVNNSMGVAPYNQSFGVEWGCYETELGSGCQSQTDGASNTSYILSTCAERPIAASICANYGDGNWYLPAINQLETLYNNRNNINSVADEDFTSTCYRSSTENGSNYVYSVHFNNGITYGNYKMNTGFVRCVRNF